MASAVKSAVQSLKRYVKKPWEITGPCASPEFLEATPKATDCRVFSPASIPTRAIVPTANPETVYDIKYFSRDQRRNRPPIKLTALRKADVVKMVQETNYDVSDFPKPYLTTTIIEDLDAIGGGYQKLRL